MATSSFEREVLKSGYLTKSPSSGGRGRLKRRWFVLTSSKQDNPPASGNGASASSSSSFRLDYYEKENHARKGKGSLSVTSQAEQNMWCTERIKLMNLLMMIDGVCVCARARVNVSLVCVYICAVH